jgi:hypothetical protein
VQANARSRKRTQNFVGEIGNVDKSQEPVGARICDFEVPMPTSFVVAAVVKPPESRRYNPSVLVPVERIAGTIWFNPSKNGPKVDPPFGLRGVEKGQRELFRNDIDFGNERRDRNLVRRRAIECPWSEIFIPIPREIICSWETSSAICHVLVSTEWWI